MKITYVSVRYGATIGGGAEQACRQLAEHLAAEPGLEVEVQTTCATDAVTWADDTEPGVTVENGVTVHRHRSVSGRGTAFLDFSNTVFSDPARQTALAQHEWLRLQGPVCPDAVTGALDSGADLIACTPYLYWPTVETVGRSDRVILHPAAHDEAPIHLSLFAGMFRSAAALAFYTDAERRLVERLWPSLSGTPQLVCGLGVDGPGGTVGTFVIDRPYVLYFGRVDDGKGAGVIARFFATYKRRRPGPLALVFAGQVVHAPPQHPDIITTGPVTDDDKWAAMAGASALVHPSANESFGIVLLESWAVGRPVLVNAHCPATVEHVRRSGGGLTFGGYAAFETALDRLMGDADVAAAMGEAGREYGRDTFAWPVVTTRYRRWLERLVH